MKWEQLKNELTQEKIRRKKAEQTIKEVERELKEARALIIKINGQTMRFLNKGE